MKLTLTCGHISRAGFSSNVQHIDWLTGTAPCERSAPVQLQFVSMQLPGHSTTNSWRKMAHMKWQWVHGLQDNKLHIHIYIIRLRDYSTQPGIQIIIEPSRLTVDFRSSVIHSPPSHFLSAHIASGIVGSHSDVYRTVLGVLTIQYQVVNKRGLGPGTTANAVFMSL